MSSFSSSYGQQRQGGYDNRRHDDRRGGGGGFWGGSRDGGGGSGGGGNVSSRWANLDNDNREQSQGYGGRQQRGGDERLAGKWDNRGGYQDSANIDWTKQLPRDERLEKELFKGANSGSTRFCQHLRRMRARRHH
ncbi:unnamed protein product [Oikopleura dioica]|uniref:Uncharacterized protein n=1 Tax=Oikopleura dioica TaxID=34765 RepID=E4Z5F7_OIKDI|nr:unnamed protein product [Oikopleura dioica]